MKIKVKPTAEGWRVWFPLERQFDWRQRQVYAGDVVQGSYTHDGKPYRYIARAGGVGFGLVQVVDSPGLPCELERPVDTEEADRAAAPQLNAMSAKHIGEVSGIHHDRAELEAAREALEEARSALSSLPGRVQAGGWVPDGLIDKIDKALEGTQ